MILKNIIYNLIYLLDYYTINYDNTEFIHILSFFLQSHFGRLGPACVAVRQTCRLNLVMAGVVVARGVVVVAIDANPKAWRSMRTRRHGDRCDPQGSPRVAGPVLVPVNLLPFYMFRLISLSGFLHDTINFNLAKLFNRCNSILSKTDHFTLSF